MGVGETRTVARQAAGHDKISCLINRRDAVARRHRDDLIKATSKKRIGAYQQRSSVWFSQDREFRLDVVFGTRAKDIQSLPGASGVLNASQLSLEIRVAWVEEHRNHRGGWNQFAQKPESLSLQHLLENVHSSCVAVRSIKAVDQTGCDWIGVACEDNWNRCCCRVGGDCRGGAPCRDNHRYGSDDQIPSQRHKSIGFTIRGAVFDRYILAFDVAGTFQGLAECCHQVLIR